MSSPRVRLRELGHALGRFRTGARNALVDVEGVRVGHATLIEDPVGGPAVRTGVTAVLPHRGNVYAEKVLGACHVINGYGKLTGLSQLAELGTIESPVMITGTLSVGAVWEGGLRHALDLNPDAGRDRDTVNVIVAECFDGYLSDARGMHVRVEHALEAIETASADEVAEGAVGAGTGTTCLGFKSGVGMASRVTETDAAHTLGALVVTNYGARRDLHLLTGEASVSAAAGDPPPEPAGGSTEPPEPAGGSVVVVLATDAPLSERQLRRLAARATFGLARAGSFAAHPSGDYVLAFSTAHRIPHRSGDPVQGFRFLRDDSAELRELFEMAGESTQEAILNSLCRAAAMEGRDGHRTDAFPYELLEPLLGRPPGAA